MPGLGVGPNSIAVDAVHNLAYVAFYNANSVAVVDLPIGVVVGLIPVGYAPASVALDAADGALIVANDKGIGTTGYGVAPPPTKTAENSYAKEFGLLRAQDVGGASLECAVSYPSAQLTGRMYRREKRLHPRFTLQSGARIGERRASVAGRGGRVLAWDCA